MCPALATEETVKVAKATAILSEQAVKGLTHAESEPAGPDRIEKITASELDSLGADLDSITPASGAILVDGFLLPEDDEIYDLVFSIERKRSKIVPVVIGLQQGFSTYLPLSEIGRALRFKVNTDLENETIRGFFINEENTYEIDNKAGTFSSKGTAYPIPENSVIVQKSQHGVGDIYVTTDLLNQIWPLEFSFEEEDLALRINTVKSLPRDLEIARQKRREKLLNKSEEIQKNYKNLIHAANGYRAFSLPVLNVNTRTLWESDQSRIRSNLNLQGQSDLIGTSAKYNLGLEMRPDDTPEVKSAFMKFSRLDFSGKELPYGLKRLEFGDISAKVPSLIDNSIQGAGVSISNKPLGINQGFDELVVDGLAEPGWEVELYNNNDLLEFGFVDERGEYRFENVPLNYGRNNIKVVLYGPQGQIEEREQVYNIASNMLKPGDNNFEATYLKTNRDLIRLDDRNDNLPQGSTFNFHGAYGLNKWLTPFGSITKTPTEEGSKTYLTAGANFSALGGIGQFEAYKQLDGGQAYNLRYANKFAGLNYNLRGSKFSDFESEDAGFENRAKDLELEAKVGTRLNTWLGSYGLNFEALYERFQNDTSKTRLVQRTDTVIAKARVSNRVNTSLTNGKHTITSGSTSINTTAPFLPDFNLRADMSYDVWPKPGITDTSFELRYKSIKNPKFTGAVNVGRDLETEVNRFGMNASYDFGPFLAGVDANWTANNGFNIGLRANTSLAPVGPNNRYIASSKSLSSQSVVKGRLFHDRNYDGIYNEGDDPIQDAKIFIGNRPSKKGEINDDGTFQLISGATPVDTVIRVDQPSLPDPVSAPAIEGYYSTVRPVHPTPFFNFPVITTGIIDGSAYDENGQPMPGTTIQLFGQNGQKVDEVITAFDGFYLFEFVKPGTYLVKVADSHQVNVPTRTVTVTPDDLFLYGIDLQVSEQAEGVSVAIKADGGSGRIAHIQYHAPATGGTLLPAPHSSDGGFQTVVRSVRIGEHPYKVRLVLDLSAPADYKISSEDGGHVINIDLPSTAWDAIRQHDLSKHPLFEKCEIVGIDGGSGSRLRITGRKKLDIFYNSTIPAEHGRPDRMYVDFIHAKK